MALAAYAAENSGVHQLSSNQLDVLRKCIEILSPIEEITRSISADLASISVIIPYIRILTKTLEKNTDDVGIRGMKTELLHSLKSRFTGIEENKLLCLATILDPRFKQNFFRVTSLRQQSRKYFWMKCLCLVMVQTTLLILKLKDQVDHKDFVL